MVNTSVMRSADFGNFYFQRETGEKSTLHQLQVLSIDVNGNFTKEIQTSTVQTRELPLFVLFGQCMGCIK
ncbi:hypothetical protein Ciccas_000683 [Cichlidogyrus casuarinus]|uniref:Uncharacterized protein n=1 Tax=Cichlidogyrus casuarinus TaxID=1844966 RepID=A0ABD2QQ71_9PLAT